MEQSSLFSYKKAKSQIFHSNFHQEVVAPTIYSMDNFHIIMDNYSGPKPQRKVYQAKKKRVQGEVERIVSKKTPQPSKKQPFYEHKPAKIYKSIKIVNQKQQKDYKLDNMCMDVDEKVNQKALALDEDLNNQKMILNEVLQKIDQYDPKVLNRNAHEEAEFYLTSISPKKPISRKVLVRPQSPQQVRQLVESKVENDRSNIKSSTPLKTLKTDTTRPQTAIKSSKFTKKSFQKQKHISQSHSNQQGTAAYLNQNISQIMQKKLGSPKKQTVSMKHLARPLTASTKGIRKVSQTNSKVLTPYQLINRRNSLTNTRLSRYQKGTDYKENIKYASKNEEEKRKFEQLAEEIDISTLHNSLNKSDMQNVLKKLGVLWKNEKQFLENKSDTVLLTTKQSTLDVLISKRTREAAYRNIDTVFMGLQ